MEHERSCFLDNLVEKHSHGMKNFDAKMQKKYPCALVLYFIQTGKQWGLLVDQGRRQADS